VLKALYARWARQQILQLGLWPAELPLWEEKLDPEKPA